MEINGNPAFRNPLSSAFSNSAFRTASYSTSNAKSGPLKMARTLAFSVRKSIAALVTESVPSREGAIAYPPNGSVSV